MTGLPRYVRTIRSPCRTRRMMPSAFWRNSNIETVVIAFVLTPLSRAITCCLALKLPQCWGDVNQCRVQVANAWPRMRESRTSRGPRLLHLWRSPRTSRNCCDRQTCSWPERAGTDRTTSVLSGKVRETTPVLLLDCVAIQQGACQAGLSPVLAACCRGTQTCLRFAQATTRHVRVEP